MTAAIITRCLNGIALALTPAQRWEAAVRFNTGFMAQRWFILLAVVALVVLTALLAIISFNRIRQELEAAEKLFVEYAEKRGLTARERQILLGIANKAGLKRNETIFTLASAFDHGVAKMKENFADRRTSEDVSKLRTELSFLREKLGFMRQASYPKDMASKSKKLNTRQIPAGKTVYMTRRKALERCDVESTIVRNSDTELTVRLARPVKITFGESWCIRYYFGSSVWEFDTSVVSYDGDMLVLNHSDDVRFINRRRFVRVPVKKQAFIARFPFAKVHEPAWRPSEFVSAVVTELAGPGLRIESKLEVEEGERVLVVLRLDEEQDRDLTTANTGRLKIIEDIGEVRHAKAIPNGTSIAVELTGLSDSDVDEMVRITNAASIKANAENKNISALTSKAKYTARPLAAQGV
ncbi:MAG: hypothetical protein WC476_04990 [Phycisphaerae bacterium]|jgi:hypothetical protein